MRKILIAAVALAALTVGTANATAINFTYTGTTDNLLGSVSLLGDELSPNVFQITSGTDTITGGSGYTGNFNIIPDPVGFVPNGSNYASGGLVFHITSGDIGYYFQFDNGMTPTGTPVVDTFGLLFADARGNQVNLYSNGDSTYAHYDSGAFSENVVLSNIDVPEPASMALLGAGVFGLGLIRRRRA
jgi:hypothetical protein